MGPTGSGKTGASILAAKKIKEETGRTVEIISADSRAIYKYMDIGTAKPTMEERDGVPHWGIDLVEPSERFTVADWKEYAETKISEIEARGNIPMVVGGTGLYIDALVMNYQFTKEAKEKQLDRARGNCIKYLLIGTKIDTQELRKRLEERVNKMFVQELFSETEFLVTKYGWGSQAMKSDIYEYAWKYMLGELSLVKAKELAVYEDWHLAKRQMTWFKRNPKILWTEVPKIPETVLKWIQDE